MKFSYLQYDFWVFTSKLKVDEEVESSSLENLLLAGDHTSGRSFKILSFEVQETIPTSYHSAIFQVPLQLQQRENKH